MSLINTGNDPWIMEYDACEKLSREIMEQLTLRDRDEKSSKSYDAISARVRIRLKQYSTEVKQLNDKLNLASVVSSLTADERERRKRQVEVLQSKEVQLQDHFNNKGTGIHSSSRSRGQQSAFADLGTTSWGSVDEPAEEDVASKSVDDLRTEQQKMLSAQDEGLESLSKVISRQKQIAISINTEVDEQNEILDDIADNMDSVGGRIVHETNMVKVIGRKDKTWGYWLIILILLVAIIGVAVS